MYLVTAAVTVLGFLVSLAQAGPQKFTLMSRANPRLQNRYRARATSNPYTESLDQSSYGAFGDIRVGTPPQLLTVAIATGESGLILSSTLCGQQCNNQTKFDPFKSSSFVAGSTITNDGDPVVVEDDLKLRNGTDTISIGEIRANHTSLALITDESGNFSRYPFDGILGLSTKDATGIFKALKSLNLPALFGWFVATDSAEITFGGTDSKKFSGTPVYAPLSQQGDSNWTLTSTSLFVNNQTNSALSSNISINFDTRESFVTFPDKITSAIYEIMSSDIIPYPDIAGAYGMFCSLISSLPAEIKIAFAPVTGESFNLTIPSSELNRGPFPNNSSFCRTFISAGPVSTVGGSLLKYYYSIWDLDGMRLGFADLTGSQ